MSGLPRCWCGNTDLEGFSPGYVKCVFCETLVSTCSSKSEIGNVIDDEKDFYGRNYWFSHQEKDLGLENIIARARTDLSERCLHWLNTILKYKLPPARVLELGSAHGGFVYLLRQSGFDATGLEVSPWVVDFARETFGVPMLLGPIENQQIGAESFDIIVLMDVLEHLPNPLDTMRFCTGLLKKDGIIVIQTPQYREHTSFEEIVSRNDRFMEMLQEKEHLYLFSSESIRKVFRLLGVEQILFEPAIFPHYDMFLIASRSPLTLRSKEEIGEKITGTPEGRMIQALLDVNERFQMLSQRLQEADADRAARLDQIKELTQLLQESEMDRAARLDQINELTELLQKSETDRAARLDQINELTQLLQKSEADRMRRLWTK